MKKKSIKELEEISKKIRCGILETMEIGKKSHLGGSMSSADLVTALYFSKMNHNPKNPDAPERDRFIFSKGHSVLTQYAALEQKLWDLFCKDILKQGLLELKQILALWDKVCQLV